MSANGKSWLNMQNGTFNFSDKIKFDGNEFNVSFSDVQELNETFSASKAEIEDFKQALKLLSTISGFEDADELVKEYQLRIC